MEIKGILRFCLASLTYHMSFLREALNPERRIFSSPLCICTDIKSNLQGFVQCRTARPGDMMRATGVTPNASFLAAMRLDRGRQA